MLDFEVHHEFPTLGKKVMLLNGRRIKDVHFGVPIVLLAIEDITERRRAEQVLQEAQDRLESLVEKRTAAVRKLSANIIHLQDDERRKISRELHDSVGQYLASAKMSVENLMKRDGHEKDTQALSHVADTLEKCLTETRTISHLLHPPLLDEVGFASAACWYIEGFSGRSNIHVNMNIPKDLGRLPGPLESVLYRILQESLTNVHRHAQTQSVDIQLELGASEVVLEIRDHGRGMPRELLERFATTGQGVGVGLNSMRERVNDLGGRFEIRADEKGTSIRVSLLRAG
jgi:signal transduction histidine kinase